MTTKKSTSTESKPAEASSSPGSESETQTEQEPTEGMPQEGSQDEPFVDPWAGTRMEGRSPEEIRSYMSLLENTVMEQNTKLTEAEKRAMQVQAQPTSEPEDDTDFFSNPRAVIRQELEAMVKPINDQIDNFRRQGEVNAAWARIKQEIPDFEQYEPHVRQILVGQNIPPERVTPDLLRSLYYTAVGYVARHGGSPPTTTQLSGQEMGHPQVPPTRQTPQVGVPQHRPSSAPLPQPRTEEPKLRTLTENEKRLAREWGLSHEEYLRLQEASPEDVITMDMGGGDE